MTMNENINRVLAELDEFRMTEEITYAAYSRLYDSISELDDLLKTQDSGAMTLEQVAEYHGLTPEGVDYALRQYQIIISEITHGMLSKLSYDGHDVLKYAQERWCDTCELKEAQKSISPVYEQLLTQEIPRCGKCGYRLVKGNDKYCCQRGQEVKWNDSYL